MRRGASLVAGLLLLGAVAGAPATAILTDEPPDRYGAYGVHDVDGDGYDDILDIRFSRDHSPTWTTIARNGRTGERLWRHTTDDTLSLYQPARVGADGRNGFVRVDVVQDPVTYELTKYRYVGVTGDGEEIWAADIRVSDLKISDVELFRRLLRPGGFLDRGPGRAVDIAAADVRALASTFLGGIHLWMVQPLVISGVDGAVRNAGTPITVLGTFTPTVHAVGDLTGDGGDDLVVMHSGPPDEPEAGVVEARDGADGQTMWRTTGVEFGGLSWAQSAGEMTGDRIEDVVVHAGGSLGGTGLYIDLLTPLPRDVEHGVVMIEGSEGEVRWHKPGHEAYVPGDVDGDGRGELVVIRYPHDEPGDRRLEIHGAAYGGFGEVRWARTFDVLDIPADVKEAGAYSGVFPAGDVHPDGIVDLVYVDRAEGDGYMDEHTGIVDARTGREIRKDHLGAPYLASVDGRGDDFGVVVDDGDGGFTIRSEDGLTGAEIWRVRVDRPVDVVWTVAALRADGDACAEVVASVHDGDETSDAFAFRGADATPLWSLRRHRDTDSRPVYAQHPVLTNPGCLPPAPARGPEPSAPPPPAAAPGRPVGALPATGGAVPLLALGVAALAAVLLRGNRRSGVEAS